MDLNELREIREHLQKALNFCPSDDAPMHLFWQAERRAEWAEKTLGNLLPVFAVLDALDALSARVSWLEELAYKHLGKEMEE